MHELAVTKGLLKICLEEGEKHKIKKIRKINIKVGELTDLLPACIEYYFNIVSKDKLQKILKLMLKRYQLKLNVMNVDIVEF